MVKFYCFVLFCVLGEYSRIILSNYKSFKWEQVCGLHFCNFYFVGHNPRLCKSAQYLVMYLHFTATGTDRCISQHYSNDKDTPLQCECRQQ